MVTNSSILNPSSCVTDVNATTASKIAFNVTQDNHGFTVGTPVRWNSGIDDFPDGYTAAQANSAYNAEVVGIVSEVTGENTFELTIAGIVKMDQMFSNTTGVIPAGMTRDDVYFLSGYTQGWMDSQRPTTQGWVAKPLMTRIAEDANGSIYGAVTNYVGSLLGGNVAVSLGSLIPVGTIQAFLGEKGQVPQGWAYCDGVGFTDEHSAPGFKVTKYPEYFSVIGRKYGWVETLKTNWQSPQIGDRVEQVVDGRTISGIVAGISGGADDNGRRYVLVKQSYDNDIPMELNGNFFENKDDLVKGSDPDEKDKTISPKFDLFEFAHSEGGTQFQVKAADGSSSNFVNYTDVNQKNGVYSVLPPDLRSRMLFGAEEKPVGEIVNTAGGTQIPKDISGDPDVLARKGGHSDNSLQSANINEDGEIPYNAGSGSLSDGNPFATGWSLRESNMPPYMTVNWIVRVDPTAYAAIIDKLEIKNLKLTNLPTSDSGAEQYTVYRDDETLKIKPT